MDSAENQTDRSPQAESPQRRTYCFKVRRLAPAILWLVLPLHVYGQTGSAQEQTRLGQQVQVNPASPQEAFTAIENRRSDIARPRTPINRQKANVTETPAVDRSRRNPIWTTLGLLCMLLAGLYGILHLLRRIGRRRISAVESQQIQLVARQRLDSQTSVFLLRVGRRLILAGSSPSGLNRLTEIDDPEEVSELCGSDREAEATSFTSLFSGARPIRRQAAPAELRMDATPAAGEASSAPKPVAAREAWHA